MGIKIFYCALLLVVLVSCQAPVEQPETQTEPIDATDSAEVSALQERVAYLKNQLAEYQGKTCTQRSTSLVEIYQGTLNHQGELYEVSITGSLPVTLTIEGWFSNPIRLRERDDGTYTGTYKIDDESYVVTVDLTEKRLVIPFFEEALRTTDVRLTRVYRAKLQVRGNDYPLMYTPRTEQVMFQSYCTDETLHLDVEETASGELQVAWDDKIFGLDLENEKVDYPICPCS